MALINCPECNKEISDKAISCPHCGYPIDIKPNKDNKYYDIELLSIQNQNKIHVVKYLTRVFDKGLAETKKLVESAPEIIARNVSANNAKIVKNALEAWGCKIKIRDSSSSEIEYDVKITNHYNIRNSPIYCPHCGSASVTTGQRGFSLFSGFFGSNKTVNRCGNCGWTWEPRR